MAAVTLKGVTKSYDGRTDVLTGIDLDIADGEFVVLVGPSGCGKSTLLRCIAGLEQADQGEITIDVTDYAYREWNVHGRTADQVTAREHVDVLCVAAGRVDSAVSKTCNVSPNMAWEDFKGLYTYAWANGAKGCTTFNPGGKRLGIFTAKEPAKSAGQGGGGDPEPLVAEEIGGSCTIDLVTGRRSCE